MKTSLADTETYEYILNILGLNSTEKKILRAISTYSFSITDIASKTGLPRTSLLYILKKLEKRSLAIKIRDNKRFTWKSNVIKSIRQVQHATTHADPSIIVHRGAKAIFEILEEWKQLPKNTRVSGIQPDKSVRQALRKNKVTDLLRINEDIKKQGLIVEGIVHEKSVSSIISEIGTKHARNMFNSFVGRLEDYVKIPDEFADVESEIYIYKNTAHIINWHTEIAISIHDKDMVELLKAMFSCVKEMGSRYSQNEKMKLHSPK